MDLIPWNLHQCHFYLEVFGRAKSFLDTTHGEVDLGVRVDFLSGGTERVTDRLFWARADGGIRLEQACRRTRQVCGLGSPGALRR